MFLVFKEMTGRRREVNRDRAESYIILWVDVY